MYDLSSHSTVITPSKPSEVLIMQLVTQLKPYFSSNGLIFAFTIAIHAYILFDAVIDAHRALRHCFLLFFFGYSTVLV